MYGYQYVCQYYCTLIFDLIKPLHSSIISIDSTAILCDCKNNMMIKEMIAFSMYFQSPYSDFCQWDYLQIYDVYTAPYFWKEVLNAMNILIICLTMLGMSNIISFKERIK